MDVRTQISSMSNLQDHHCPTASNHAREDWINPTVDQTKSFPQMDNQIRARRKYFTVEEQKAARKLSREKHRAKPGIREKEKLKARERRERAKAQLSNEAEKYGHHRSPSPPTGALEDLDCFFIRDILRSAGGPIPTIWHGALENFLSPNVVTEDDRFWVAWEPSVDACRIAKEEEGDICSEEDRHQTRTLLSRMHGRLARREVYLGQTRYNEVEQATLSSTNSLVLIYDRWMDQLKAAEAARMRWEQLMNRVEGNSRVCLMTRARQEWIIRHSFYLAEALCVLSDGAGQFMEAWRNGLMANSYSFMWKYWPVI